MSVHALMRDMSALEETYWLALYRAEPWGDLRADYRSAQIAQLLFNQNVKRDQRRQLSDFMPFFRKKATVDENVGDKLKDRFSKLIKKD